MPIMLTQWGGRIGNDALVDLVDESMPTSALLMRQSRLSDETEIEQLLTLAEDAANSGLSLSGCGGITWLLPNLSLDHQENFVRQLRARLPHYFDVPVSLWAMGGCGLVRALEGMKSCVRDGFHRIVALSLGRQSIAGVDGSPSHDAAIWCDWSHSLNGLDVDFACIAGIAGQSNSSVVASLLSNARPRIRSVLSGCHLPYQNPAVWCSALSEFSGTMDQRTKYFSTALEWRVTGAPEALAAMIRGWINRLTTRRHGQSLHLLISEPLFAGVIVTSWQFTDSAHTELLGINKKALLR